MGWIWNTVTEAIALVAESSSDPHNSIIVQNTSSVVSLNHSVSLDPLRGMYERIIMNNEGSIWGGFGIRSLKPLRWLQNLVQIYILGALSEE